MKDEIRRSLAEATPGPWKFGNAEEGKRIILGGSGNYVCNVQIYQTPRAFGFYDEPTREANAHLIANAPTWLKWQNERIDQLEKELERFIRMIEDPVPGTMVRIRNSCQALLGKDD